MSSDTGWLPAPLRDYLLANSLREHPDLAALRRATDDLDLGGMYSSPEQMQLIQLLIELTGAERIVEIGCFTGYGTLAMALALPQNGRIVTLDVNDNWAGLGRDYWSRAGVEGKIDFRCGLALESLDALIAEGQTGTFDLAYVDADKKTYITYYERALTLVRPGGLVLLDNVLWGGEVADPAAASRQTETLRALNATLHKDERVSIAMLPIGDGLTLARKRG